MGSSSESSVNFTNNKFLDMKKIIPLFLLFLLSVSFANTPNKPKPVTPIVNNQDNSDLPQISEPNIISLQNFYIAKSYDEKIIPDDLKKWTPWVNKNNYTKDCIDSNCIFIPKLTISKKSN